MDSHSKRSVPDASSGGGVIKLRLYVAGNSPNSMRAFSNLRAICTEYLADGRWEVDVVDVLEHPLRAVEDKILVTPTLLRLTPPSVRVIGDLSERQAVLEALNIATG